MTIIFVLLERAYDRFGAAWKLNDWDPSRLPRVKPDDRTRQRPLPTRIADLAFHCLWMAYVIEIPRHPYLLFGPAVSFVANLQITWAPAWHTFYVAFWFLLLAQLGIKIANLFSSAKRWTTPLDLIARLFNIVLAGWLAANGPYVVSTGSRIDSLHLAVANYWVGLSIAIALACLILDLVIQTWKYLRPHLPVGRLAF
jgi:hypothetical protein